jgi:hypothetical protein
MNEKERLVCVLQGQTPDRVPWYADLGHWFRAESGQVWDLFNINNASVDMLALHREVQAGWYIEVGSLHDEIYDGQVTRERGLDGQLAIEQYHTPLGSLSMIRRWNPRSFSWDIVKHLIEKPEDLRILTYTQQHKQFVPRFERWQHLTNLAGDMGLGFPSLGYTGLGALISYYMGIEATVFALADEPEWVEQFIAVHHAKQMELVRLYAQSPAPHFIFSDNLSSDVQSPSLFRQFSLAHYRSLAACLHTSGKTVSAHIDGRMNGLLGLLAEAGIDIADACTPKPSGDLDPDSIRRQAGETMIIMGGISPMMWLPETPEKIFVAHVKEWLDLRKRSSRLIQSAGDQVPPGTSLQRIRLMHEIVEAFGRYDRTESI